MGKQAKALVLLAAGYVLYKWKTRKPVAPAPTPTPKAPIPPGIIVPGIPPAPGPGPYPIYGQWGSYPWVAKLLGIHPEVPPDKLSYWLDQAAAGNLDACIIGLNKGETTAFGLVQVWGLDGPTAGDLCRRAAATKQAPPPPPPPPSDQIPVTPPPPPTYGGPRYDFGGKKF